MSFLTKAQILTKHIQVSGLASKLNVPLPEFYLGAISLSGLLNFDWAFFNFAIPDLPRINFQIQFIAGCVVLPLAVMLATLVAFLDFYYLECFVSLAVGVLVFLASATSFLENAQSAVEGGLNPSEAAAVATNPAGAAARTAAGYASSLSIEGGIPLSLWLITALVIVIATLFSIVFRLVVPRYVQGLSTKSKALCRCASYVLEPVVLTCALIVSGFPKIAVYCVMSLMGVYYIAIVRGVLTEADVRWGNSASVVVVLLTVAVVVVMWMKVDMDPPADVRSILYPFGYLLAVMTVLGCALHILEVFSDRFNRVRRNLQGISDRGFLTACYFFICSAMVPVVTNCLQMFMCVTYSCPSGTVFNPFVTMSDDENGGASADRFCDACAFNHNPNLNGWYETEDGLGGVVERNVCAFASEDLCPSWSDRRLLQHPDTSCSDGTTYPMLVAAAVVSLVVFGFVMNAMFYKLTSTITATLVESTKERLVALRKDHAELVRAFEDKEFIAAAKRFAIESRRDKERQQKAEAIRGTNGRRGTQAKGDVAPVPCHDHHRQHRRRRRGSKERMLLGDSTDEEQGGEVEDILLCAGEDETEMADMNIEGGPVSSYPRRKRGYSTRTARAYTPPPPLAHSDEDKGDADPLNLSDYPDAGDDNIAGNGKGHSDVLLGGQRNDGKGGGLLGVPERDLSSSGEVHNNDDASEKNPSTTPAPNNKILLGYDVNIIKVVQGLEKPPDKPPSYDDAFADVCARITPKASSLYSPYRFPLRYFMLVDNFHRLLLVFSSVVLAKFDGVGVGFNVVAHFAMFVFILVAVPFHDKWEQTLSIIATGCDTLGALYVLLLFSLPRNETIRSDAFAITVSIITLAVPFVAMGLLFGVGMYTSWHNPYKKAEAEKMKAEKKARKSEVEKLKKEIEIEKAFKKELGQEASCTVDESRLAELQKKEADPNAEKTNQIDNTTKRVMLGFFMGGSVPWLVVTAVLCMIAVMQSNTTVSATDNFVVASDSLFRDRLHVLGGRGDWEDFTQHCCCFESSVPMDGFNVTERWVCSNLPHSSSSNGSSSSTPYNYSLLMAKLRQFNGSTDYLFRGDNSFALVGQSVVVSKNRRSPETKAFVKIGGADDGIPLRSICGNSFRYPHNCSVVVEGNSSSDLNSSNVGDSATVRLVCNPPDFLSTPGDRFVTPAARSLLW